MKTIIAATDFSDSAANAVQFAAAVAALIGSWAFLIGSLIRWYVVMEIF